MLIWGLLGLIFIIKASSYCRLARELFFYNVHLQHIPVQVEMGVLPVIEDTIPAYLIQNLLSIQPRIEKFFVETVGVSYFSVFMGASFLCLLMGILGAYFIGSTVSKSKMGGLYATAALLWGWVHLCTMAYLPDFRIGMYPGILGISLGYLSLGLWFRGHWKLALTCVGILANLHLSNALIIGCIYFTYLVALLALKKLDRKTIRDTLWGGGLAITVAVPQILLIVRHHLPPLPASYTDLWWTWMELRKTYHLFPWKELYQVVQLGMLSVLTLGGLLVLSKKTKMASETVLKAWALFFAVLGLCFLTWFGGTVLRNSEIASSILARSSVYLVPLVSSFLFVLGRSLMEQGKPWALAFGGVIWSLNFLSFRSPRIWLVMTALICLSYLWVYLKGQMASTSFIPRRAFLVIFCAFTLGSILFEERRTDLLIRSEKTSDWKAIEGLHAWATSHTDKTDVFLIPPTLSCAAICLGRIPLVTHTDIGISVYLRSTLPREIKIMKSVFGVDLEHDLENAKKLNLGYGRFYDEKYDSLTEKDALRIAKDFPGTRYMVTFKGHTLKLPLKYQNASYSVYLIEPNS